MVTAATSFSRNGVADWIIQRFTALILASYVIFITIFIFSNTDMTYTEWSGLFNQLWMRTYTLLVVLSIIAHGWIGLWGVVTDYFTTRLMGSKGLVIRMAVLGTYAITSVAFLAWGINILWGGK